MEFPKIINRELHVANASPSLFWSEKSAKNIPCFLIPVCTTFENGRDEHSYAICFSDPLKVNTVVYSKKLRMLFAFVSTEE